MLSWTYLVSEIAAMFAVFRFTEGKRYGWIGLLIFALVCTVVGICGLWIADAEHALLRWLFWAVPMICVFRLGDLWKKRK